MNRCAACGITTPRRHCAFCRKTIALISARRCVSCAAQIFGRDERIEGKCDDCLSRNNRLGPATRKLLHQAANARVKVAA